MSGVLGFRGDHVVHHVVALANLFDQRRSWKALSSGLGIQFGSELSPVDIIAHAFGQLVGQGDRDDALRLPGPHGDDPFGQGAFGLWATRNTDVHPTTSILRRYRLPFLVMAPSLSLPPLECWLGVMPRDALKSLPDLKTLGWSRAAIADAISGPKRGCQRLACRSCRLLGDRLLQIVIFSSRPPLCGPASPRLAWPLRKGLSASASASNSLTRWMPLGAIKPNSGDAHAAR